MSIIDVDQRRLMKIFPNYKPCGGNTMNSIDQSDYPIRINATLSDLNALEGRCKSLMGNGEIIPHPDDLKHMLNELDDLYVNGRLSLNDYDNLVNIIY